MTFTRSDNNNQIASIMLCKNDKEIEHQTEKWIEEVKNEPKSAIYFDPVQGWVMPERESNTHRNLKQIIAALQKEPSDEIFTDVECVLYTYQQFPRVRQGVRETFSSHKHVSWYLTDHPSEKRSLINYQDGPRAEWANDCFADEVPLWLLIGLLRRIKLRKPLGDQATDETIGAVVELDVEHVQKSQGTPVLTTIPQRRAYK